MSLDHQSLKIEPKEKRFTRTMNVSNVDLNDHRQDHQLLLLLKKPIEEVVGPVQVQFQWTHLEEGEEAEVDFYLHYHHLKKKSKYE